MVGLFNASLLACGDSCWWTGHVSGIGLDEGGDGDFFFRLQKDQINALVAHMWDFLHLARRET
jgi:hypothetical protein